VTVVELGVFARVFPAADAVTVADAVRDAGYTTAQLNLKALGLPTLPSDDEWAEIDAAGIAHAFEAAGVSVWGVSASYNMCHPDTGARRAGRRRAIDLIARAGALGAGVVTLCTGSRNPDDMWGPHPLNRTPEAWHDLRAELDILLEAAETAGVRLGVEPETGAVLDDARSTRRLLDELADGAELVRVVLDPANLVKGLSRPQIDILRDAFQTLASHVGCLHAKDTAGWTAALAGAGNIDLALVAGLHAAWTPTVPVIVQDVTPAQARAAHTLLSGVFGTPAGSHHREEGTLR
jgi:sugar phosphate isomerase/epimerase